MKLEVTKPRDKILQGAIASSELTDKTTIEENGQFVVFTIECTPLEAFKLGMSYHNLKNQ